jgi:hypothetical protein
MFPKLNWGAALARQRYETIAVAETEPPGDEAA